VDSRTAFVVGELTHLGEAARMRPGSGGPIEVLLRLDRAPGSLGARAILLRWSPEQSSGTRLAMPQELESGRYRLGAVTSDGALLVVENVLEGTVRTLVADLAGGTVVAFDGDLTDEFVLLPGAMLYSLSDTHVHTRDTLEETALPLALAPGPEARPPFGDSHLIVRE
jgi:hypothetical protein